MDLYIAICEDQHADVVVKVFTTEEKAINYAKRFVEDNCRFPEDVREGKIGDWLYYCQYSGEGDFVWVVKDVLNNGGGE